MDERVLAALRNRGYTPGDVLGSGMEGSVVDLSDGKVAKVWNNRSRNDLSALVEFGHVLDAEPIPFATATAVELLDLDGLLITIERKVTGVPLRLGGLHHPPIADATEAQMMGDALAGLANGSDPCLGVLPALPGDFPLDTEVEFGQSLGKLAARRFAATPSNLRAYVPDIESIMAILTTELGAIPRPDVASLIHGDLIPANVLISDGKVSGVVDFGFLTMIGDPQFDAAITASIFDMYGVNARRSEDFLSEYFLDRFSHDRRTYALYRGAYAVITHAVFGDDWEDGHFAWCVAMLHRADFRNALAA